MVQGRVDGHVLVLLVLLLSLVEERVRAEVEKCLLRGLEPVSLFMKCRFRRRRVRLTFSTTNPSMSITFKERKRDTEREEIDLLD